MPGNGSSMSFVQNKNLCNCIRNSVVQIEIRPPITALFSNLSFWNSVQLLFVSSTSENCFWQSWVCGEDVRND
jgi:hypothetical protein